MHFDDAAVVFELQSSVAGSLGIDSAQNRMLTVPGSIGSLVGLTDIPGSVDLIALVDIPGAAGLAGLIIALELAACIACA